MDRQERKDIIAGYKLKTNPAGIYGIRNKESGKIFIRGDENLDAVKNRFLFSQKVNSAYTIAMTADWNQYGVDAFEMEILEEIKPRDAEAHKMFKDRLKKAEDLWKSKYPAEMLY